MFPAATSQPNPPRAPGEAAERAHLAAYLAAHFAWDWAGMWDRHADLPALLDEIGGWTSVYDAVRVAAREVAEDAPYTAGMTGDWYLVSDRVGSYLRRVASAHEGWNRLTRLRDWREYRRVLPGRAERPRVRFPIPPD